MPIYVCKRCESGLEHLEFNYRSFFVVVEIELGLNAGFLMCSNVPVRDSGIEFFDLGS